MAAGIAIVTGASSGIGEATAVHLRGLGFDVHAGVRKDADADRLSGLGLQPVKLDVTDADSIAAAVASLDGRPVAALVNNAGIAVSAPLELVPIDQLRNQMEINFIGQVAVTQAFLPALRAARGRIVNVSSIGGRVALPLAGPYAASKFALEAVTDSLRRELGHLGVKVIAVEPGGVKTPIWDKGSETADSMLAAAPPDVAQLYRGLGDALRAEARKIATETGVSPDDVAKVIGQALTSSRPRTRYLVGRDAKARAALARVLPDRVLDRLIARALSG
jgi:NAD(P)-dependent dehydrogenase (short-subunit alcohol dehydrogenase family)